MSENLVKDQNSVNPQKKPYGYIYKITNKINGKVYVGKHAKSELDESYWGSGLDLNKDLKKLGIQSFDRQVLDWCNTNEELNEREIFWIEKLNTFKDPFHYNLTSGGDGIGKGFEHSEETLVQRAKKIAKPIICLQTLEVFESIQKAAKKFNVSGSSISDVLRGIYKHKNGYYFEYYDKAKTYIKQSLVEIDVKQEISNKIKKHIICLQTLEVFDSTKQASEKLDLTTNKICAVLTKNHKHTKGYSFEFYDPEKNYTKQPFVKNKHNYTQGWTKQTWKSNSKRIICLQTLEVFDSLTNASLSMNLQISKISTVLNNKREHTKGYSFEFYDPEKTYKKQPLIQDKKAKQATNTFSKAIICLQTLEVFSSSKLAAENLDLNFKQISESLRDKMRSAKGYTFKYYDESIQYTKQPFVETKTKQQALSEKFSKKIKCIETNQVFDSVAKAALAMNLNSATISSVARKKQEAIKGFHFEYV